MTIVYLASRVGMTCVPLHVHPGKLNSRWKWYLKQNISLATSHCPPSVAILDIICDIPPTMDVRRCELATEHWWWCKCCRWDDIWMVINTVYINREKRSQLAEWLVFFSHCRKINKAKILVRNSTSTSSLYGQWQRKWLDYIYDKMRIKKSPPDHSLLQQQSLCSRFDCCLS